ncbi:MAG: hypothetical protein H0V82_05555 [Candidatus Protochlamydia sp.]|nr:hypothetical protein [Candidatus Protochlamydia sp.]
MNEEGYKAKSLTQVRDFSEAASIYESLSKLPLPDWQHALVLYNWGTVKLLQQEWEQSLERFNQVPLSSISTPALLRSLAINKGFAFLGQAKLLATLPVQDFEEQIYLVRQSQIALQDAFKIDCRIQQLEKPDLSECRPFFDPTALMDQAHYQIRLIRQQQREHFLSLAKPGQVNTILIEGLERIIILLQDLEEQNENYMDIIYEQASSLRNLWTKLVITDNFQEKVKIGEIKFDDGLASLQKMNFHDSIENFGLAIKALVPLFPLSPLESLLLHYHLVLMEEIIPFKVAALSQELRKLQLETSEAVTHLEKAFGYLTLSLEEPPPFLPRFYLILSFISLNEVKFIIQGARTPLEILKQAFQIAKALENLTQLTSLKKPHNLDLLKFQQGNVLKKAAPFLDAVLLQEKENLKKECQRSPWDQVLPLFEKGLVAAQQAQTWMSIDPFPFQAILKEQKKTIENWKQAVELLENPPSSNQQNQPQQEPSAASDINDAIRQIQEMQAQDKSEQEGGEEVREGNKW